MAIIRLIFSLLSLIIQMHQSVKENRQSSLILPQFSGQSYEEQLQMLYDFQKSCQKNGKYLEANIVKKKFHQVKSQFQNYQRNNLRQKFEQDKKDVQLAHIEEVNEFNDYWDHKMADYKKQAEHLENEITQKHEAQFNEFQEKLIASLASMKKQSGELINLRKIEDSLAKQQNYIEAHKVHKRIEHLQKIQSNRWNSSKDTKMKNLLNQLKTKQQNESNALRQKIIQGFEQQKNSRKLDYIKLVQKFQNFIKQLQSRQNHELIKFDKCIKMQSTLTYSKSSNMSRVLKNKN